MIAQFLNRDFLLGQCESLRLELVDALELKKARGVQIPRLKEFSNQELEEVLEALKTIPQRPSAHEPAVPAPMIEGEAPRPKDDFAFVPQDDFISMIQTAFEDYYEEAEPNQIEEKPLLDDRRAGLTPVVTDRQLKNVPLTLTPAGRRRYGPMEITRPPIFSDPMWAVSGIAMGWRAIHGRALFKKAPAGPIPIGDHVRLLLVGDWGSGIPRAKKVADKMGEALKEGTAANLEQYVIHLGDVYYAGGKREYQDHFLRWWPVPKGSGIKSFSLCGNHDMYWGGHAYYDTCLADPRFAAQGGTSYFSLRNANWEIFALDTGHEDGGLRGDQAKWVRETLDQDPPDPVPQRKTMLLTHHQPFSAYQGSAEPMRTKLADLIDSGRIDAWFWGHEHRCLVYKEHQKVRWSSCVGHGGIPEYLIAKEGDPYADYLAYDYRKQYGTGEPWETFGFAIVELKDADMTVQYVDEDGNPHYHHPPQSG